tara:strand:- start:3170 stop:4237 length:1068 start_codon:yes stop_codon:yes gene_type:complete
MAIAGTQDYWTSRFNGVDPTVGDALNTAFSESGATGVASTSSDAFGVGYWKVSDKTYSQTPTTNAYTIVGCFYYETAPSNGTVLMKLDNGSAKVEVQVNGTKFNLVGASTASTVELNPADSTQSAVILRLTLTGTTATLYAREIVTDSYGEDHFIQVTGSSSVGKTIQWGNTSGIVHWASLYATDKGAFAPQELSPSQWTTNTLYRLGLSLVEQLKSSPRMYLKTHVDDSSIVYGYDISGDMLSRIRPPSIHVMLQNINAPETISLGGAVVDLSYSISVLITTVGADYKEAYILGAEIAGEVFDELYTNTGLNGTTDALDTFTANLDTKRDDDETVCIHQLLFTYRRRTNLRRAS